VAWSGERSAPTRSLVWMECAGVALDWLFPTGLALPDWTGSPRLDWLSPTGLALPDWIGSRCPHAALTVPRATSTAVHWIACARLGCQLTSLGHRCSDKCPMEGYVARTAPKILVFCFFGRFKNRRVCFPVWCRTWDAIFRVFAAVAS